MRRIRSLLGFPPADNPVANMKTEPVEKHTTEVESLSGLTVDVALILERLDKLEAAMRRR